MKDRLMAVEVWYLWRMLRISWTEKISNDEVLQEAEVQHTVPYTNEKTQSTTACFPRGMS